jgi:truncated hemoglobin YjbI
MGTANETLYEHAGGDEGLHHLEEIFYAKALADSRGPSDLVYG